MKNNIPEKYIKFICSLSALVIGCNFSQATNNPTQAVNEICIKWSGISESSQGRLCVMKEYLNVNENNESLTKLRLLQSPIVSPSGIWVKDTTEEGLRKVLNYQNSTFIDKLIPARSFVIRSLEEAVFWKGELNFVALSLKNQEIIIKKLFPEETDKSNIKKLTNKFLKELGEEFNANEDNSDKNSWIKKIEIFIKVCEGQNIFTDSFDNKKSLDEKFDSVRKKINEIIDNNNDLEKKFLGKFIGFLSFYGEQNVEVEIDGTSWIASCREGDISCWPKGRNLQNRIRILKKDLYFGVNLKNNLLDFEYGPKEKPIDNFLIYSYIDPLINFEVEELKDEKENIQNDNISVRKDVLTQKRGLLKCQGELKSANKKLKSISDALYDDDIDDSKKIESIKKIIPSKIK